MSFTIRMMKKLQRYGFILLLTAGSCCKEVCPDESMTFRFRSFPGSELDSIQFVTYQRGTSFANPLDSFWHLYAITSNAPQDVRLTIEVNLNRDVAVRLPSAAASYRVTDVLAETVKCNCESGDYRRLKSFKLNNTGGTGEEIEIVK